MPFTEEDSKSAISVVAVESSIRGWESGVDPYRLPDRLFICDDEPSKWAWIPMLPASPSPQ